jgi:hypothetical protein
MRNARNARVIAVESAAPIVVKESGVRGRSAVGTAAIAAADHVVTVMMTTRRKSRA